MYSHLALLEIKDTITNYSQYSPVEALNLIVESKSLPIEVNNSTIELHLQVEVKEKLATIDSKCGSLK